MSSPLLNEPWPAGSKHLSGGEAAGAPVVPVGPVIVQDYLLRDVKLAQDLDSKHLDYLRRRGVSANAALSAGIRSLWDREAKAALGRRYGVGPGMAIPFDSAYWVVRVDYPKDGRKFVYPAGAPSRPYLPPNVPSHVWRDPAVPLVLCEGPVKALALSAAGVPAIGLAGATGGAHDAAAKRMEKRIQPHEVLRRHVSLLGRQVVIMLDSDIHTNENVRHGEEIAARALASAGAIPFLAPVPVLPGHEKLGADDYLMLVGVEELSRHLVNAAPWIERKPKPRRGPSWSSLRFKELVHFIRHHVPPGVKVAPRQLYCRYVTWAKQVELPAVTETMFFRRADAAHLLRRRRSEGRRFWVRSI